MLPRNGAQIIYTDHIYFSENDFTFEKIKPRNNQKIKKLSAEEDTLNSMIQANFIACASTMIEKKCLFDVGLYDESLKIVEDFDMGLRLCLKRYKFQYLDKVLTAIRRHKGNISGNYQFAFLTQQKIKDKICSQNNIQIKISAYFLIIIPI